MNRFDDIEHPHHSGYPSIGDYAIIGDTRTAALVSRSGSIDWLCLRRFDSPSVFGAILDRFRGGYFRIAPAAERIKVTRSYVGESNVLRTVFRSPDGEAQLTDCFAVTSESARRHEMLPDHEILRSIQCTKGRIEIEVVFDPRPHYGLRSARLARRGEFGWIIASGRQDCLLRSEIELRPREDNPGLAGRVTLETGEQRSISLSFTDMSPQIAMPMGRMAAERIERSIDWWKNWASRCSYEGPHRPHVVRSALVLKLLTYAPSGAVVAAPTTSLPEMIGGSRNWDYRYCWLRDASMTIRALLELGHEMEGRAFLSWLMYATRLHRPELHVLYNVHGDLAIKERELAYLDGYRKSRPVRIGNDAVKQLQLDIYGTVTDAAYEFAQRGGRLGRGSQKLLIGFAQVACSKWKEPDAGIWEFRGGNQHNTLAKVMCWVTVDRILKLHQQQKLKLRPKLRRRFEAVRDEITETVEREGYNPQMNSYAATLRGDLVDASLLLMPLYGYIDARHPRMVATVETIRRRLATDSFVYRYDAERTPDGQVHGEGAFALCTFWYVQCLARMGRIAQARQLFKEACGHSNDLGLFAEEFDTATGEMLGNFPQAYTHIGLINAAGALSRAERGESWEGAPDHQKVRKAGEEQQEPRVEEKERV